MMFTRVALGFVCALLALGAQGATRHEDTERFLYVWSASAEVIVEGSIAAFESVDLAPVDRRRVKSSAGRTMLRPRSRSRA